MALTKEQKKKVLKTLKEKIGRQKAIIFVGFTGLTVQALSELRRNVRENGGELIVAKKTLVGLILKELNPPMAKEVANIQGEIGLIIAFEDALASMKTVYKTSASNANLKILSGLFEERILNKEEVITLAQLPSQEELWAKFVGTLGASLNGLVGVLQGNLRKLVFILANANK